MRLHPLWRGHDRSCHRRSGFHRIGDGARAARARRAGRRDRQSQRLLRSGAQARAARQSGAAVRQQLPLRATSISPMPTRWPASRRSTSSTASSTSAPRPGFATASKTRSAYVQSNLVGHCNMLELARQRGRHMVYASSSSVYGGNNSLPFRVEDRVDHPLSLYAATKKADELMSESYANLYRLPLTGPALLHGLRAVGPARHGDVDLHQGAVRRRAVAAVQRRRDAARFHLHRRYRERRRRLPRLPAGRRRRGQGRRQHQRRTRSTISATAAAKT